VNRYQSKSFVYYGPGDVRCESVELACGPTDLIVRVDACGRCGTDRKSYVTQHASVVPPIVLGHEFSGEIVEVGAQAELLMREASQPGEACAVLSPGQRVTVQPKVCSYHQGVMQLGRPIEHLSFRTSGAFAQYVRIPAALIRSGSVLRIPDGVSSEEAALVEPAACVLESVFSTPHVRGVDEDGRQLVSCGMQAGGRTIVIGSGTLALLYAAFARLEGAHEVHVVVRSDAKAALVRRILGDWARVTVFPDHSAHALPDRLRLEKQLVSSLRDATDGQLFDDVVLAVSSADAQRYAFELLTPSGHGAVALFAGLQCASESANVDLLHYRMAKAIGTTGCSTRTMRTVLRWLEEGRLSLKGYCDGRKYTLDDDPSEFFQADTTGLKLMLYPWA
jgi:L-iditol 2-dehydrogenase